MILVNDTQINFDLTAPDDLRRYTAAGEAMAERSHQLPDAPKSVETPAGFAAYVDYVTQQCAVLTDFIDAAFGNGVCNALLGPKTSLTALMDACDAIGTALEVQGADIGIKIQKYTPNRATRRNQK